MDGGKGTACASGKGTRKQKAETHADLTSGPCTGRHSKQRKDKGKTHSIVPFPARNPDGTPSFAARYADKKMFFCAERQIIRLRLDCVFA